MNTYSFWLIEALASCDFIYKMHAATHVDISSTTNKPRANFAWDDNMNIKISLS